MSRKPCWNVGTSRRRVLCIAWGETAITASDLLGYLNGYSDFSFELQTLSALRALGLECEHAGLYEAPVAVARAARYCVRLAIECKNVHESFPLLVSCVPRHADEAFHDVALVQEATKAAKFIPAVMRSRASVWRIESPDSCYEAGGAVGKA